MAAARAARAAEWRTWGYATRQIDAALADAGGDAEVALAALWAELVGPDAAAPDGAAWATSTLEGAVTLQLGASLAGGQGHGVAQC